MNEYTIYDKDKCLQQIQEQIQNKKKILFERKQYLENNIKENRYLKIVQNKYLTYNNSIVEDYNNLIYGLNILNEYINEIITKGDLSKKDIVNKQNERQKILDEINSIQNKLNILKKY